MPAAAPAPIGKDGYLMLVLSGAIVAASVGVTLLAALGYVVFIALRASSQGRGSGRILVLGMRLRQDGTIPELYRQRLERARMLAIDAGDIVVLGGAVTPGARSEAEAGRAWLTAAGIAPERLHGEDRSRHTLENLLHYRFDFVPQLAPVLLVTNRFHLARSSLLANGLGIAHWRCAAEAGRLAALCQPLALLAEAKLVHWYIVWRGYARLTQNRRMTARIS